MYLTGRPLFRNQNSTTHFLIVTLVVVQHLSTFFNTLVLKTEQNLYQAPREPRAINWPEWKKRFLVKPTTAG